MKTCLANLTGIPCLNNPATKCNELCGCEFSVKVSALKSKGEKKSLHRHSVPVDNVPLGPCPPEQMPWGQCVCSYPSHHFPCQCLASIHTQNPGCWLQWYLQRWNHAAVTEACSFLIRKVDKHFTDDGFGQRFWSDSALLPFALWCDCWRCCVYFIANG